MQTEGKPAEVFPMIQYLFEVLNQSIERLEQLLPAAKPQEREEAMQIFQSLHEVSEEILERWMQFIERLEQTEQCFINMLHQSDSPVTEYAGADHLPKSPDSLVGYFDLQLYQPGLQLLQTLVSDKPQMGRMRLVLAYYLYHRHHVEEALLEAKQAVDLTDDKRIKAYAYNLIGNIWMEKENHETALSSFKKAIRSDRNCREAWLNQAVIYYRLKDYRKAVYTLSFLLQQEPQNKTVLLYMAVCFRQLAEPASAFTCLEKLRELTNEPFFLLRMAGEYEIWEQWDAAYQIYRDLLYRRFQLPTILSRLAWLDFKRKYTVQAFLWIKKALTIAPYEPETLLTYAYLLIEQQSYDRVEKVLNDCLNLSSQHRLERAAKMMLTRLYLLQGKNEEMAGLSETMMKSDDPRERAMGSYQMGRSFLQRSRIKEAHQAFQEAAENDPLLVEARFFLSLTRVLQGAIPR
jgi:tetratricopeptide (TPR) repeat protein